MNESLSGYLYKLKISPKNKGYACIKECLRLIKVFPKAGIKEICERCGQKLNIGRNAVKQNIIYSIENAWLKADTDILSREFGSTIIDSKAKPTLKQFLYTLSDRFQESL